MYGNYPVLPSNRCQQPKYFYTYSNLTGGKSPRYASPPRLLRRLPQEPFLMLQPAFSSSLPPVYFLFFLSFSFSISFSISFPSVFFPPSLYPPRHTKPSGRSSLSVDSRSSAVRTSLISSYDDFKYLLRPETGRFIQHLVSSSFPFDHDLSAVA